MKYNIIRSDKQKFVWYRTPKCGGSSFFKYFDTNTDLNTDSNGSYDPTWESYFKFAIVRNPWDRLVSSWKDKVEKQWNAEYQHPQFRIKYFKQFYDKDFSFFVKNIDPYGDVHLRHQHTLICTDHIDFIGRFETLRLDFKTICDTIGKPKAYLTHENKTNHKHYTEYYDDETRQIVAEIYAKDIEYFGYKFGD